MAPVCQAEESLSTHFHGLLAHQVETEVSMVYIRIP